MSDVRIASRARRLLFIQGAAVVYPNLGDDYGQPFCAECAVDHADGGCKPECCAPWSLVNAELVGVFYHSADTDYPVSCVSCKKILDLDLTSAGVDYVVETILTTDDKELAERWARHDWSYGGVFADDLDSNRISNAWAEREALTTN